MDKIITFSFAASGTPCSENREALASWLEAATPWLHELDFPRATASPLGLYRATLWGSNAPWNTLTGLTQIADASPADELQEEALEALFPLALMRLLQLRYARVLGRQLTFPAKRNLVVLYPALGATWNGEAYHGPLATNHERLNNLGYRTAKTLALHVPRGWKPSLGAGYLFPIDGQGRDIPRGRHETVLEIHR